MIRLTSELPEISKPNAEYLKIKCLFDCYKDDDRALFWSQDGGRAFISMADGNMTIRNKGGAVDELKEFISVLSPDSIFSDYGTLKTLSLENIKAVNVMYRKADISGETAGDSLSSREIYDILNVKEFTLPEYPYFAVDFCRRLNNGYAEYYAVRDKCAAVSFNSGNYALLNGIVSREKGMGSTVLKAILQKNYGRGFLACCTDELTEFYEKNGFKKLYKAGYWWKQRT